MKMFASSLFLEILIMLNPSLLTVFLKPDTFYIPKENVLTLDITIFIKYLRVSIISIHHSLWF